jgi:diaminopimelate epimerase
MSMTVVKAHAFGNDFVLAEARMAGASPTERVHADAPGLAELARAVCDRHRGIGADGLILYSMTSTGAVMRLLNADGSRSEVSGNGVRCLAAWIASQRGVPMPGQQAPIDIETEAGVKRLELLGYADGRYTFRAAMGSPEQVALERLDVNGQSVEAVTLRVGNPQCVVLGPVSDERLRSLAAPLAVHPRFSEGTNVELADVESRSRVRILIWERGVGPTQASGTGACAAAVAAMQFGGAARDVEVVSPGGVQRVEWTDQGLFLTGWAELIAEAAWLRGSAGLQASPSR